MTEKFLHAVTKWRFWLGFQFILLLIINIIGNIISHPLQQGNTLYEIFVSDLPITLLGFFMSIIGFPSGIYFLFMPGDLEAFRFSNTWLDGKFIGVVWPVIYYTIFFFLTWYITKQKRNWKIIAIGLILFMTLSFIGLNKIVEPLLRSTT